MTPIPGPISLLGGGEHMRATETIDRRLMELTGVARPQVVALPFAASHRQRGKTAALARNHWSRLGARFSVARLGNGEHAALDALANADIVVLPGGHPNKLISALGDSPITDLIIARWRDGAGVSGSSAGAMAMFEWRLNLYPPSPLRTIPGLGLLDGYIAAPHFDRFRAASWSHRTLHRFEDLDLLGIDESTGLVGFNSDFEVVGLGELTVVNSLGTHVYKPGDWVSLDLCRRGTQPHRDADSLARSLDSDESSSTSRQAAYRPESRISSHGH